MARATFAVPSYAIALGSNRRHGRYGGPRAIVEAALRTLDAQGLTVMSRSKVHDTPAMGVPGRSYANAAAIIATDLEPLALLHRLKAMERTFGRRAGQRWGSRVLDLDILFQFPGVGRGPSPNFELGPDRSLSRATPQATSKGRGTLILPHPALAHRNFVLQPLEHIAPDWRHPRTGLTVRQMHARLHRAKPVDETPPSPLRKSQRAYSSVGRAADF